MLEAELRNLTNTGTLPSEKSVLFQISDVRVLDNVPKALEVGVNAFGDEFLDAVSDDTTVYASHCTVVILGSTHEGKSVCVCVTNFRPYLFFANKNATMLQHEVCGKLRCKPEDITVTSKAFKNTYGWEPNDVEAPTDRKEHRYLKVEFATLRLFHKAKREFPSAHENFISPETKFFDSADVGPSQWVFVHDGVSRDEPISHCSVELTCRMHNLKAYATHYETLGHTHEEMLTKSNMITQYMVASLDIECVSASGGFPEAANDADVICMIGITYWRYGTPSDAAVRVMHVVGECDPVDNVIVRTYATERCMLLGVRREFVLQMDPDILVTYNGFGFDLQYMCDRAQKLGCREFWFLSRFVSEGCEAINKELSSSALGANDMFLIEMKGRMNLDLYHWIKANKKLESYKLDYVGERFVGQKKVDMDYKALFAKSKTPAGRSEVAFYCAQDCFLLILLLGALQIIEANTEMSRTTFVLQEMLITRGQQIKVINQLVHYSHRMGYILNTPVEFSGAPDDNYEGATVIEPIKKYHKRPIAVLDFMSLYPSIIRAHNFCYSTLVQNPTYLHLKGVEYTTICISETEQYTFVKNMPGILPVILAKLHDERCKAKKLKAEAPSHLKAVFDARQLSIKVSMNSLYGFTGALKTGKYRCLAVCASTTKMARQMLLDTVRYVKEFAPCEVVYGDTDSVMVDFYEAKTCEEAFALGDTASEVITRKFPENVVLEMEKVYDPYLLLGKKKYVGLMFVKSKDGSIVQDGIDAKGIEIVRRDSCKLAKGVLQGVCDELMYHKNPQKAMQHVQSVMYDIVENNVPREMYEMSKSRKKQYKNTELPHLRVVELMESRARGSAPQVGDRVPYVLIKIDKKNPKTWEMAEDPAYAALHNLPINRLYYVEHQIVNSVHRLFEHVEDIPSPSGMFAPYVNALTRQQNKMRDITTFLDVKVDARDKNVMASMSSTHSQRTANPSGKQKKQKTGGNQSILNMLVKNDHEKNV